MGDWKGLSGYCAFRTDRKDIWSFCDGTSVRTGSEQCQCVRQYAPFEVLYLSGLLANLRVISSILLSP